MDDDFKWFLNYIDTVDFSKNAQYPIDDIGEIICSTDSEFTRQNLSSETLQIKILFYLTNKSEKMKKRFLVMEFLASNFKDIRLIEFKYREKWKKFLTKICSQDLESNSYLLKIPNREEKIATLIQSEQFKKYHIVPKNGVAEIPISTQKIITKKIEKLICQYGPLSFLEFIVYTLLSLTEEYNIYTGRFLFPHHYTNFEKEITPNIPWGFLFNITLKHLNYIGKNQSNKNLLLKIIDLSSNFVYLLNYHFNNKIDRILSLQNLSNTNSTDSFLLSDSIYNIKQCSTIYFPVILEQLFSDSSDKFLEKNDFPFSSFISLIKKTYKPGKTNSFIKIEKKKLTKEVQTIYKKLSHTDVVNYKYNIPSNIGAIDFYKKPLISLNNGCYLLLPNFSARGFYEYIYNSLEYIDIGNKIEDIVKNEAKKSLLKIHYGKYNNSHRECDLVIEEANCIHFVEIKKKTITQRSYSGDKTQLDIDLCESFLNSQEQLLNHELFIRNNKKIVFKNGSILNFKNQKINKISITLFDLYSFNEHFVSMYLFDYLSKLRFLIQQSKQKNDKVENKNIKKIKQLNRKISNVNKYIKELHKTLKTEEPHNYKFNTYFFPVEFILFLFEELTKTNKTLDELISLMGNISFCSGDCFGEYYYSKKIKYNS